MLHTSLHRLAGAVLALCWLGLAGTAAAETVKVSYLVPKIGSEVLYGTMGYTDEQGSFIDLAGSHIVSSTVTVDFRPARGVDVDSLFMAMSVPVSGAQGNYFVVQGTQLERVGRRHYTYTFTTDEFNGRIEPGRFSVESYGLDADGNPVPLKGRLGASTGFHYTVDVVSAPVPEPASAALLLGGLAVLPLWARRRRG